MSPSEIAQQGPGYETRDMRVRSVAAVLGGFAAIVAVSVAGIGYGLHVLGQIDHAERRPVTGEQETRVAVPGPKVQAMPVQDLAAVQAREDKLVGSYAWMNPAHSAARIPIERAMLLVVGRSLDPASPRAGAR